MGGMTKDCKRQWASALDIDADYDDCWHYRQHWRPDLPLLTRLQYLDFHTYLPDDILTKVDRASMAHSLELRVPFLKRELIEFAFSLPEHIRYDGGRLKGILKHAYRDILPASILNRSKKGFSVPPSHLAAYGGRLRETILTRNHNIRTDANCLPFRLDDPVAQGQQHSGHADVPGLRQHRA
jgi:asparagine synthetase B (glutamine-hydrolysing)